MILPHLPPLSLGEQRELTTECLHQGKTQLPSFNPVWNLNAHFIAFLCVGLTDFMRMCLFLFQTPSTVAEDCGQSRHRSSQRDEDVCRAGAGVQKGSDFLSVYLQVVFVYRKLKEKHKSTIYGVRMQTGECVTERRSNYLAESQKGEFESTWQPSNRKSGKKNGPISCCCCC